MLGQTRLGLHWRSHTAMLRYALQLHDGNAGLTQSDCQSK